MLAIDRLIAEIANKQSPVCVGLDTVFDYVPDTLVEDDGGNDPLKLAARAILKFNCALIDAVHDIVPAVKVQAACYEKYGWPGVKAFYKTLKYAKKRSLITIADVKRGDIGSSADAYSRGYLQGADVGAKRQCGFDADFITVNPYFGTDGVAPFVRGCEESGKGIFCLVKTSNPSSGEFQDINVGGNKLYELVGDKVAEWGKGLEGGCGYSSVGAVVGATYPEQAGELRARLPKVFFLVPGYGAQGATAADIAVNFDAMGRGAVVNSSRGILLAYKKDAYASLEFDEAARRACLDMRDDIAEALASRGVSIK